jgi:hypothetical protein
MNGQEMVVIGLCKVISLCEWTMQVVLLSHETRWGVERNHRGQCMMLVDHERSHHCVNGQCVWC